MDKFLSALPAFVEVCRRHSFTRAAENLDMPIASLSRRIASLEAWLGVQLFTRSKRRVELTDAARVLLGGSEKIVADSRHVLEQLRWRQGQAGGRIRLLLPSSVYHTYLRDALGMFAVRYPGIEMHVHFTTRWMDLTTRPFDLAVCTGPVPDTGLLSAKLLDSRIGLYAAPALFERRALPGKPEELAGLPYIYITSFPRHSIELWRDDRSKRVRLRPAHFFNDLAPGLDFALAGQGYTAMESGTAEAHVRKGRLLRLLPEWKPADVPISMLRPKAAPSRQTRLLEDFLLQKFAAISA